MRHVTELMHSTHKGYENLDRNQIAFRAYELWLLDGCMEGRALAHWFAAERELAQKHADQKKHTNRHHARDWF